MFLNITDFILLEYILSKFQSFICCSICFLFVTFNLFGQTENTIENIDSLEYIIKQPANNTVERIKMQFTLASLYLYQSEYLNGLINLSEARIRSKILDYKTGEGYYFENLAIFHRNNTNSFSLDISYVYKEKSLTILAQNGLTTKKIEQNNPDVNWKYERAKLISALEQLDALKQKEEIANVLYSLQYNCIKSDLPDSAIYFGNKAISIFTNINNPEGLFCASIDLMHAYHNKGKSEEAIEVELRALKIINDQHSIAVKGDLYELLAIRYDEVRRYSAIINCLLKANEIWRALNNKRKLAKNLILLGTYYTLANGDSKTAYGFLKEALTIKDEIADSENIHELYTNLILKANGEKDFANADIFILEGKSRLENTKDAFSLGRFADAEGQVLLSQNKYAEAKKKFEQSVEYFNQDQFSIFRSYSLLNLSLCLQALGMYEPSLKNALLAYTISQNLSWNDVKKKSSLLLSDLYKRKGNLSYALKYLEINSIVQAEIVTINDKNKIKELELEKLFEVKKKEQEEIVINLNNEIERQRKIKQYSIFIFIGILSISLLVFYNQNKNLKLTQANLAMAAQIKAQETLLTERTRISRELHDEVGSTLSGISMYSHLVNHQIDNAPKEEVVKSLGIMRHSAGEMISKLNDIIWLTNPEEDSFEKFVFRLKEYAIAMTIPKGMQLNFLVDDSVFAFQILPEIRHNLYLICKESINNAIKYSNASLLTIEIIKNESCLSTVIKDNGIGFDLNKILPGNGLFNLRKRAEEIKANLIIDSAPGRGCAIILSLTENFS